MDGSPFAVDTHTPPKPTPKPHPHPHSLEGRLPRDVRPLVDGRGGAYSQGTAHTAHCWSSKPGPTLRFTPTHPHPHPHPILQCAVELQLLIPAHGTTGVGFEQGGGIPTPLVVFLQDMTNAFATKRQIWRSAPLLGCGF